MPLRCLTAGRMTMSATLLHREARGTSVIGDIDLDQYGEWVGDQDPLTGEIVRIWKPKFTGAFGAGPDKIMGTSDDTPITRDVQCIARGVVDGGIRSAGNTEIFGDSYENIEFVRMWVPSNVRISKRDRVTNIKDPRGRVMWADEEFTDPTNPNDIPRATVFNVNGVTPLFDAFNNVREQFVVLQRAEVVG